MKEFLIQFVAGFLANMVTALLLYALIDRWLKRKEHQREEAMRSLESLRIQRISLLQQFPPVMQRLIDIQRDAFACALVLCDEHNASKGLQIIANNLRHFANVQLDAVSTLASLGANTQTLSVHSDFTNLLAIIAVRLVRNEDVQYLPSLVKPILNEIVASYPPEWRGFSHIRRMRLLLEPVESSVPIFGASTAAQRQTLLCNLGEAVGHNTNLLLERVNEAFDEELRMVRDK